MRVMAIVGALAFVACGGAQSAGGEGRAARRAEPVRVSLVPLVPAGAEVVLRADLDVVREGERYEWFAEELTRELGLAGHSDSFRPILDRTDGALGVLIAGRSGQEGFLVFAGRYDEADHEAIRDAAAEAYGAPSGAAPTPDGGALYGYGDATMRVFGQEVFAIAHGQAARAVLAQVSLTSAPAFHRELAEFGPRIGLPDGSAQAWAKQGTDVGTDMIALVFEGENPAMVHNFVGTVRRHLGL